MVTLMNNGVEYEKLTASGEVLLPEMASECRNEKWEFAGWTPDATYEDASVQPEPMGVPFCPVSDTTLYAVYRLAGDSVTYECSAGVPEGWKFSGRTAGTGEWELRKGEFLITGAVDIQSVEAIGFVAKYFSSPNKIRVIVAGSNDLSDSGEGSVYSETGQLSDAEYRYVSVDIVPKETENGTKYVKICPFNALDKGGLSIKSVTIRRKPKYSIAPECTDVPMMPVNVTLVNGDERRTLVHTEEEPVKLPQEGVHCSAASEAKGWMFEGWSAEKVTGEAPIAPKIIDGEGFVPTTDTTLYAVFRYTDYEEFDDTAKVQEMVIAAVTSEGCRVLSSGTRDIPYGKAAEIEGVEAVYIEDKMPVCEAVAVQGHKWVISSGQHGYRLQNGAGKTLFQEGDKFIYSDRGNSNMYWGIELSEEGSYMVRGKSDMPRVVVYDNAKHTFSLHPSGKLESSTNLFPATLLPIAKSSVYSSDPYHVIVAEGDTLIRIEAENEYLTDEIRMFVSKDGVGRIEHNVPVRSTNGMTISVDFAGEREYCVALPFDCEVGDVDVIAGDTLKYGEDWHICEVGLLLENNTVSWVRSDEIKILRKGVGYNVVVTAASEEDVVARFVSAKQELIFDVNSASEVVVQQVFSEGTELPEVGTNSVSEGWYMIASPYLGAFSEGEILCNGESVGMVSIPVKGGFRQMALTDAQAAGFIVPLSPFMVQTGRMGQGITFDPNGNAREVLPTQVRLIVSAESSHESDSTVIVQDENSTEEYETGQDLLKLKRSGIAVYTTEDGVRLAYNVRPIDKQDKIQVGVQSEIEQEVEFSLNKSYELPVGAVYLYDNEKDKKINLSNKNYKTEIKAGETNNRFSLHFQNDATATASGQPSSEAAIMSYIDGQDLVICGVDAALGVKVTDVAGRCVYKEYRQGLSLCDKNIVIHLSNKGIYIISIDYGDNIAVDKVVYY